MDFGTTAQLLGNVGEFLGAIGVVVSLVFVGFISSVFGMFKYFELMFLEHGNGNTDDTSWNAWGQHILLHFHQAGVQAWWKLRRATFHPDFRTFLDNSAPPDMRSFAELIQPSTSA